MSRVFVNLCLLCLFGSAVLFLLSYTGENRSNTFNYVGNTVNTTSS